MDTVAKECYLCKQEIHNVKDELTCHGACKGSFHFLCGGLTELNFRKMNHDYKNHWKCNQCRKRKMQRSFLTASPGVNLDNQEGVIEVLADPGEQNKGETNERNDCSLELAVIEDKTINECNLTSTVVEGESQEKSEVILGMEPVACPDSDYDSDIEILPTPESKSTKSTAIVQCNAAKDPTTDEADFLDPTVFMNIEIKTEISDSEQAEDILLAIENGNSKKLEEDSSMDRVTDVDKTNLCNGDPGLANSAFDEKTQCIENIKIKTEIESGESTDSYNEDNDGDEDYQYPEPGNACSELNTMLEGIQASSEHVLTLLKKFKHGKRKEAHKKKKDPIYQDPSNPLHIFVNSVVYDMPEGTRTFTEEDFFNIKILNASSSEMSLSFADSDLDPAVDGSVLMCQLKKEDFLTDPVSWMVKKKIAEGFCPSFCPSCYGKELKVMRSSAFSDGQAWSCLMPRYT